MNSPPSSSEHEKRGEKDIIASLQQTVSASRLGLFLQCRLKFYFRYIARLSKPKPASLHVGNSVHAVFKAWNKARWIQKPLTLKQVHDTYDQAWTAQQKTEPVNWEPGEEEQEKMTGWRLCEVYLRESHVPADVKPDAVEVPVDADLKSQGLPRLIGTLDLVQRQRIIDYKTTSTTPNADKVAHHHEIQTSAYAVLYRTSTETKEAGLELHHLVKLKNPKVVITTLPPMTGHQQTRLFRFMEAYVDGLDRAEFIPSPGMQCQSCEFFQECRRWR